MLLAVQHAVGGRGKAPRVPCLQDAWLAWTRGELAIWRARRASR